MESYRVIHGGIFSDDRGDVRFVNDFDLKEVRRFYLISNSQAAPLRAWQAHKVEKKWFYVTKGAFEVSIVRIEDWDHPESSNEIFRIRLTEDEPVVLYVPGGYANSLKSLSKDSCLQVYSNMTLEAAGNDQFRFPEDTWIT
ncbi:hypothetical protein [Roseivirga thermotolerans]|uniref:hypothetical protein n=1 Tax=Roseivirga thermotolerans TaxID=1758176 RepID=UPI00273F8D49|nr:hypothetical protein [Roseivirga thermotolerans]